MFDMPKIKKFSLADLIGRTLYIYSSNDNEVNITIAFDVDTGESFIIDCTS